MKKGLHLLPVPRGLREQHPAGQGVQPGCRGARLHPHHPAHLPSRSSWTTLSRPSASWRLKIGRELELGVRRAVVFGLDALRPEWLPEICQP